MTSIPDDWLAAGTAPSPASLWTMPDSLFVRIAALLPLRDLGSLACTSRAVREACAQPDLWACVDACELSAPDGRLSTEKLRALLRRCRLCVRVLRMPAVCAEALAVAAAHAPVLCQLSATQSAWPPAALVEFVHSCPRLDTASVALLLNVGSPGPDFGAACEALRLPCVRCSLMITATAADPAAALGATLRSAQRELLPALHEVRPSHEWRRAAIAAADGPCGPSPRPAPAEPSSPCCGCRGRGASHWSTGRAGCCRGRPPPAGRRSGG